MIHVIQNPGFSQGHSLPEHRELDVVGVDAEAVTIGQQTGDGAGSCTCAQIQDLLSRKREQLHEHSDQTHWLLGRVQSGRSGCSAALQGDGDKLTSNLA